MVTKAIIPISKYCLDRLPATKEIPNEMAVVVDKPVIDYIVQEALLAGIKDFILLIPPHKNSVVNYFDDIKEDREFNIYSVLQRDSEDLGTTILQAKNIIKNDPFAVLLPNIVVEDVSNASDLKDMIEVYSYTCKGQVLIAREAELPCTYPGRFVFPSEIIEAMQSFDSSENELLLKGIEKLKSQNLIEEYKAENKYFDCGSEIGYLEAILQYGVKHPELGDEFKELISEQKKNINK